MFSKKAGALIALPIAALVLMGMRGISSSHPRTAKACPGTPALPGQSSDLVSLDGTNSTRSAALRIAYENAASNVVIDAVKNGAFLNVSVFGGSLATIKVVCETSTETSAAAPLFAVANETALTSTLDHVLVSASKTRASDKGSDVYGALVGAIESENALGASKNGGRIVILTDGAQATSGLDLPRLLGKVSDRKIAKRIVGSQPVPRARAITIEIRGIGQGAGESFTTPEVRRISDIWVRICKATHPRSCVVTADL